MWGDLHGQHIMDDTTSASTRAVTKLRDCRADALDLCSAIYQNQADLEACKYGTMHGEIREFSSFPGAYITGNLVEKFKCGGLRPSDQCVNYRATTSACDRAQCTHRLLLSNERYSKIDLSHSELASPHLTEILKGELLSRLRC